MQPKSGLSCKGFATFQCRIDLFFSCNLPFDDKAASKHALPHFVSFSPRCLSILIEEISVFLSSFHISFVTVCPGGGLPGECGATCGVIHLKYEL